MNLTITHTVFNGTEIKDRGINENAGAALVTNEKGKALALITRYHPQSNAIYLGYKALLAAISVARRVGADHITIETDANNLRKEIKRGGEGVLYRLFLKAAEPFEVSVRDFDLSDEAMESRAWLVYAAAGLSLGLQESDRWADL